ncbi:splicing factor YJU2-like [Macrobrachium nipponense]|uniref:splicing factor YJU2-like n=1 Tax=Macrobrachium nipponense TaxID=159736 RepID=UPI0030C81431
MSERKVLNKYYPPDFDPSKIPRARCPRNRQFTVRLMVPCNIKCHTCGEYIAKGKKFNARKEDVEDMTYLGVRIYRFYIKCPGCLAEISFRTDPESTDYVIEAGAHRNFQALKLAEEQAAREEREAKEEIESNPMLLLENRTQQSQYEMEVLESLEDLRDMNERHAGIDLGKITEKYEEERKMTQEQREEAEKLEALKALGYEMIEGQMVKRVAPEDLLESQPSKKLKPLVENTTKTHQITPANKHIDVPRKNTMKSKLTGLIKVKGDKDSSKGEKSNENKANNSEIPKEQDKGKELAKGSSSDLPEPQVGSTLSSKSVATLLSSKANATKTPSGVAAQKPLNGLSFLGAYSDSESGEEST